MREDAPKEATTITTDGIYVLIENALSDEPESGFVLEVAGLFGLMHDLNHRYPANLCSTFDIIQEILMKLDGGKL